jgi:hypothetical protein
LMNVVAAGPCGDAGREGGGLGVPLRTTTGGRRAMTMMRVMGGGDVKGTPLKGAVVIEILCGAQVTRHGHVRLCVTLP